MNVKKYVVRGYFRDKNGRKVFKKVVPSIKKEHAIEKVYSDIGSKHKVKRRQIDIESVEEEKHVN